MELKKLKRLRRRDLLEMLLDLTKENEQLRERNAELEEQLQDRMLTISEVGSLAEAVVKINRLMEAAQEVCDQYTDNIKKRCEEEELRCQKLERSTKQRCDRMLIEAAQRVEKMLNPHKQKEQTRIHKKTKPLHKKK
jgi:hypothetical protein